MNNAFQKGDLLTPSEKNIHTATTKVLNVIKMILRLKYVVCFIVRRICTGELNSQLSAKAGLKADQLKLWPFLSY